MKTLLTAVVGAALLTASALANDTMDAMIGQSVTYTYADGSAVVAYYAADGTYTTDSVGSGTWTMEGDELCITTASGDQGCTELEAGHGSGDTWDAVDTFGNPVTISIS